MLASAAPTELYSADDFQYFGPGANGKRRSQHFSPTESTPTALGGADTFRDASYRIALDSGESLTGTLYLYTWTGDYATTIAGTPLGSVAVSESGPVDTWITVSASSDQAATGQYLLSLLVGTVTGTDFGLYRSASDDGGTNNDAYNDASLKTDREYQVQLAGGTLPITNWELY
jgi:hypothetical protein